MNTSKTVPEWHIRAFKLYEEGATPSDIATTLGMPSRKVSRFIARRRKALQYQAQLNT